MKKIITAAEKNGKKLKNIEKTENHSILINERAVNKVRGYDWEE